jgi:hypothetical protein
MVCTISLFHYEDTDTQDDDWKRDRLVIPRLTLIASWRRVQQHVSCLARCLGGARHCWRDGAQTSLPAVIVRSPIEPYPDILGMRRSPIALRRRQMADSEWPMAGDG